MRFVRGAFGVMEVIEAIGYLAAFLILLGLLLTGRIPHDYQLWVAGALGAMVARLSAKSQRYRTICDGFDRYGKPDIPWHVLPSRFRWSLQRTEQRSLRGI